MKSIRGLAFAVIALCSLGCGPSNDMTKDDIKNAAKSGPPTAEQKKKMADGMRAGFQQMEDQQAKWAREHPDKVAEVNAQRAKGGLPPLPTK